MQRNFCRTKSLKYSSLDIYKVHKNNITFMCMLSKMHFPYKNSTYAKFHFYGIIGIEGPLVLIFGDKSQKSQKLGL